MDRGHRQPGAGGDRERLALGGDLAAEIVRVRLRVGAGLVEQRIGRSGVADRARGARVHHFLHAGARRRLEHDARPLDARPDDVALGVPRPHEEAGRRVVDLAAAVDRRGDGGGVHDVAAYDLHLEPGERRRIGVRADHRPHRLGAGDELPAEVVAEVSVRSRDECRLHVGCVPSSPSRVNGRG